jgi:hypothetical protein
MDGDLHDQWRDMARCVESMRQMLHQPDLKASMSEPDWRNLENVHSGLLEDISQLRLHIAKPVDRRRPGEHDYDFMKKIDLGLAAFSQGLLSFVLIAYWKNERIGLVESEQLAELPAPRAGIPQPRKRRAVLPACLPALTALICSGRRTQRR